MLLMLSRARCRALRARVARKARRASAAGLLLLAALSLLQLARRPPRPAPAYAKTIKHTELVKPPFMRSLYVAGHSRPHPELCRSRGAHIRLVILVSSAPTHFARREAVRLTWGHAAQRADVALAFMLGASPPALRAALDAEDALYGDLVEGRFFDSYSNLTLKTLSMLEWFETYCPLAPRLLKTDDDVFVNVPQLLKFADHPARRNATNTVWGRLLQRSRVLRAPDSKYFVPLEEFSRKLFPDFTTGPAYLVTADAARRLRRAAPAERYLRVEDVFLTGMVAARLGVHLVHVPEFYNRRVAPRPCTLQRGIAIHWVSYDEQFRLWQKLLDGRSKCVMKRTHRH